MYLAILLKNEIFTQTGDLRSWHASFSDNMQNYIKPDSVCLLFSRNDNSKSTISVFIQN